MAYTTIDDPSAHFQANAYSGASTQQTITNGGHSDLQPDLLWVKRRDSAYPHMLFDSSRGVNSSLSADATDAEDTTTTYLASFNSDGFTTGTDSALADSGRTFVAWQWKANGGTRSTFTESGDNPAGGYQANTTAGFSIIDYTGTGATGTIAHGLGAKPDFWVIKNRGGGGWSWYAYHGSNTSAPETELLYMNNTDATLDTDAVWNDTAPTSSVFTVNTNGGVNDDDNTYICYLFTSIQGYSKFGSYTGNGNADGAFVYTGFKPALIMQKRTNSATDAHWHMFDVKRNTYNPRNTRLEANNNFGDSTGDGADFLSNGFKWTNNDVRYNGDGDTYIYMAFAENPFVTSTGIPATAR